jgi:hypothetical protein
MRHVMILFVISDVCYLSCIHQREVYLYRKCLRCFAATSSDIFFRLLFNVMSSIFSFFFWTRGPAWTENVCTNSSTVRLCASTELLETSSSTAAPLSFLSHTSAASAVLNNHGTAHHYVRIVIEIIDDQPSRISVVVFMGTTS